MIQAEISIGNVSFSRLDDLIVRCSGLSGKEISAARHYWGGCDISKASNKTKQLKQVPLI
jgi:hypothetical protein